MEGRYTAVKKTMKVIGIGESGPDSLLPTYRKWINECERLVGGERLLNFFPQFQGEKIVIKNKLAELVQTLKKDEKDTVILASGDPLFFGIGGYLSKKIEGLEIYPSLSSVQEAFSKIGESWQDCEFYSVHGRSMKGLAQKIDGKKKVALLTDETNDPRAIARYLLYYEMTEYEAYVCEALGGPEEKVTKFTLEELVNYEAHPLNVVILKQTKEGPRWSLGINDDEFMQRKPDKGLITKKEIRVLSLAHMQLTSTSTVWDIGACTGSVSIEAAKIAREGAVYAIEKNEADIQHCKQNFAKFRTDVTLVHGKAPELLDTFPDPDAIFIGGTGGNLTELLHVCCMRLKENGTIVLNAVTIENLHQALKTFENEGFHVNTILAQISRSKPILHMNRFEGLNPVYIIQAKRKEETDVR